MHCAVIPRLDGSGGTFPLFGILNAPNYNIKRVIGCLVIMIAVAFLVKQDSKSRHRTVNIPLILTV